MTPENKKIILAGAAIAIVISILAPFLASNNPDGLDKNIITLVGSGSEEHAEKIIEEKNPVGYESPFSDYSIEGMEKPGEVFAIVLGTVIMLVLALGVSSLIKKKN
ncbi:MAG: PDGLE domain-containing protein [Candidatus Methanoperedens sp.]